MQRCVFYTRAVIFWPDMYPCTCGAQRREVVPVHHTMPHHAFSCILVFVAHFRGEYDLIAAMLQAPIRPVFLGWWELHRTCTAELPAGTVQFGCKFAGCVSPWFLQPACLEGCWEQTHAERRNTGPAASAAKPPAAAFGLLEMERNDFQTHPRPGTRMHVQKEVASAAASSLAQDIPETLCTWL